MSCIGLSVNFDTEQDAVQWVVERMAPRFKLVSEVRVEHLDGSKIRMDMVAIAREPNDLLPDHRFHRFHLIGVEVKYGYDSLRSFNRALKQAIDYRHSRIIDKRSKHHQGVVPEYVFVFPDFDPAVDLTASEIYRGGYYGAVRLAGMFNVGVIRELRPSWNVRGSQLEFRVSDTPIWRTDYGVVGPFAFGTARRRGAA